MELKRFKKLNKIYTQFPLSAAVLDTPEYEEYIDAFHSSKECQEFELKRRIKAAGINYKNYCCVDMAYYLIEDKRAKNSEGINYDAVITHASRSKEFGIPIHDGGTSYIRINFCPWCGQELRETI